MIVGGLGRDGGFLSSGGLLWGGQAEEVYYRLKGLQVAFDVGLEKAA